MKRPIKVLTIGLAALLLLLAVWLLNAVYHPFTRARVLLSLDDSPIQIADLHNGQLHQYRDLNRNDRLDPYEDPRDSTSNRVEDLLGQMTLAEKAGQMFHPPVLIEGGVMLTAAGLAMGPDAPSEALIVDRHITHFNYFGQASPQQIARGLNKLQKMAARTRLGIPLTISSDPLHGVPRSGGIAEFSTEGISKWPSPLGLAATRDTGLVQQFGRIAAKEYRAMGLHTALHPMADLATEPRWARNSGTFGSNARLTSSMTVAYMKGFQGRRIDENSVLTMVKHFPGGGPQQSGWDPHLPSGKNQVYPGDQFRYHLQPFKQAIDNGLRAIMPYYGIPLGQTGEDVAIGYNKEILTDLLREELGFDGVICADWGIISSRLWGVEELSVSERFLKSINAGMDQWGGESDPQMVIELVNSGQLSEQRIDQSVRRILRNKFDLGLFDNPLVDEAAVSEQLNLADYVEQGINAQRKSIVLLNNNAAGQPTLPLAEGSKVFLDGIQATAFEPFAQVVDDPAKADVIVLYLDAVFNGNQPAGSGKIADRIIATLLPDTDLNFSARQLEKVADYASRKPLVTVVNLNRPAILTEVNRHSSALLGTFGVFDSVIAEALFGVFNPGGKLPFEIPASMAAVEQQFEDVADDTQQPVFPFGHGLRY